MTYWNKGVFPALIAAGLIGVGACSSIPEPTGEIAAAQEAIRDAESSQAATFAPAGLRRARLNLEQAELAVAEDEFEKARRLARQAHVDADLASANAQKKRSESSLFAMRESVDSLKREVADQPVAQ